MKTSFEVLNKILQGEHMAIEQYQACIDALQDSPLRNHLTAILSDHKKHATRLSYYIQTNGGHVKEGSGMVEFITQIKSGTAAFYVVLMPFHDVFWRGVFWLTFQPLFRCLREGCLVISTLERSAKIVVRKSCAYILQILHHKAKKHQPTRFLCCLIPVKNELALGLSIPNHALICSYGR